MADKMQKYPTKHNQYECVNARWFCTLQSRLFCKRERTTTSGSGNSHCVWCKHLLHNYADRSQFEWKMACNLVCVRYIDRTHTRHSSDRPTDMPTSKYGQQPFVFVRRIHSRTCANGCRGRQIQIQIWKIHFDTVFVAFNYFKMVMEETARTEIECW